MNSILLSNYTLCDKIETHRQGLQHFAFSLFIFNKNGEMLIQKRSKNKYHSGGLWSNACCSHFKNIEEFNNKDRTALNRVYEELGHNIFNKYGYCKNEDTSIHYVCQFDYCEGVGNNLIENEQDFIFFAICCDDYSKTMNISFNKNEVEEVRFIGVDDFLLDKKNNSEKYTKWLLDIVNEGIFNKILEAKK